jgi:hypothetical protein
MRTLVARAKSLGRLFHQIVSHLFFNLCVEGYPENPYHTNSENERPKPTTIDINKGGTKAFDVKSEESKEGHESERSDELPNPKKNQADVFLILNNLF